MEPSELRGTLVPDARRTFFPKILWKKRNLRAVSALESATVTFKILDDNTRNVLWTATKSVRFHSLNECVIQKYDYATAEMKDVKENIVAYVNEEAHDLIAEIKGSLKLRGASVRDPDEAMQEIGGIWTALLARNFQHDTIARTATKTDRRMAQNVRFIDQTWRQGKANCVDASVLLASIFLNMGVECKLVLYPDHCQIMVEYPKVRELDPNADPWVIETTELDSKAPLAMALAAGKRKYDSNKWRFNKVAGFHIIDVRATREKVFQLRPPSGTETR